MSVSQESRRSPHDAKRPARSTRHVEAAGQRRVASRSSKTREGVGVAELLEPDAEPETIDSGGGGDVIDDDRLPPEPPGRGGGRPDRPPRWMRLVLYGLMLIAAWTVGWLLGTMHRRIDRAAWGE